MGWVGGIGVSFRGVQTTTQPRHVCMLTHFTDEKTGWMWVTCRDLFATLKESLGLESGACVWVGAGGRWAERKLWGGGFRGGRAGTQRTWLQSPHCSHPARWPPAGTPHEG